MALTETEQKIVAKVVVHFMGYWHATHREVLALEFEDPDAIDNVVSMKLVKELENANYFPNALSFHYCGIAEMESLAKRSVQVLAQVLRKLYKEKNRDLSPGHLLEEARKIDDNADAQTIRLGMYLAPDFDLLSGFSGGNLQQPDIAPMGIAERILKLKDFSGLWDDYMGKRIPFIQQDSSGGVIARHPMFDIEEDLPGPSLSASISQESISRKIFLVHGHEPGIKETVARFLEKLGLEVTILHEQANSGRTLIEKFEAHAEAVGFAVVILTPDDLGSSSGEINVRHKRARQNVILELGYFIGKLGRQRVCPVYVEGVELPSDIHGVGYVVYDRSEQWRSRLAKEISAAGIVVDLNRIL
jgi:predicted nucleotide-binding protein